jgi:hypothetical protein
MNKEEILSFIETATDDDLAAIMKLIEAKQDDINKVNIVQTVKEVAERASREQRFVIGWLDEEGFVRTEIGTICPGGHIAIDDYGDSLDYNNIDMFYQYIKRNRRYSPLVHIEYIKHDK